MTAINPRLEILPPEQQELWPSLRGLMTGGWVLYGGTALALRLGHRVSIDFDFFNDQPIDRDQLFTALPALQQAHLLQDEVNTVTWLVSINERPVKLSFFGTIDVGRVGTPTLTTDGVAELASLLDLLAHKLKVIMQRIEPKDYRDIAALLDHGQTLEKGLSAATRLFGPNFSPGECVKALGYLDDENLAELDMPTRRILIEKLRDRQSLSPQPAVLSQSLSSRR